MAIPAIIKYPLDLNGTLVSNRTEGETITLPRSKNRAFAPRNGPFFAASFELFQVGSAVPLVLDKDYVILYLYQDATQAAGQPICAVVHLINPALSGDFTYNYQVIGGGFSSNVDAIKQAIDALELDGRAVAWDDVLDKPVQFPPAPHLHHVNDLYGMEGVIEQLQLLIQAIAVGDELMKEQILERLARQEGLQLKLGNDLAALTQVVAALSDRLFILERK